MGISAKHCLTKLCSYYNYIVTMEPLIRKLENTNKWKETLRASCKNNHICTSLAGQLTPRQLNLLQERFNKAYETYPHSFGESWIEHEMRAFNWILIVVSAERNTKISEFGAQEWEEIYNIFNRKTKLFLRYETRRFLLQKKTKNKNWSQNENEIMCQIVNRFDTDKIVWNQVARALFEQSDQQYFRTAKHCREHWLNYLDPSKNRGEWTKQQDSQLLEVVEREGKKWARIGVQFQRTEHNVKNRYNSLISKQRKSTPKIKKEQKLSFLINRSHQSPIDEREESSEPQKKNHLRSSRECLDNYNKEEPQLNFREFEHKDQLDYLLEGRQYVQELVHDEEDDNMPHEPPLHSFWCQSPKNLTPLGINPSPFSPSMNSNYYLNNFIKQMDRHSR